jgi:hypothetical protein
MLVKYEWLNRCKVLRILRLTLTERSFFKTYFTFSVVHSEKRVHRRGRSSNRCPIPVTHPGAHLLHNAELNPPSLGGAAGGGGDSLAVVHPPPPLPYRAPHMHCVRPRRRCLRQPSSTCTVVECGAAAGMPPQAAFSAPPG